LWEEYAEIVSISSSLFVYFAPFFPPVPLTITPFAAVVVVEVDEEV
jgi:hypothetical protein